MANDMLGSKFHVVLRSQRLDASIVVLSDLPTDCMDALVDFAGADVVEGREFTDDTSLVKLTLCPHI